MTVLLYGLACMALGVGLIFLAAGSNTKSRLLGLVMTLVGFVPALVFGLRLAGVTP